MLCLSCIFGRSSVLLVMGVITGDYIEGAIEQAMGYIGVSCSEVLRAVDDISGVCCELSNLSIVYVKISQKRNQVRSTCVDSLIAGDIRGHNHCHIVVNYIAARQSISLQFQATQRKKLRAMHVALDKVLLSRQANQSAAEQSTATARRTGRQKDYFLKN